MVLKDYTVHLHETETSWPISAWYCFETQIHNQNPWNRIKHLPKFLRAAKRRSATIWYTSKLSKIFINCFFFFLPQPPSFLLVPPQPELFVTVLVLVPHLFFFYAPIYVNLSGIFWYLSFFSTHCSDRCNRQGRVEDEEGGKLEILFALPNFVSLKSLQFSTKGLSPWGTQGFFQFMPQHPPPLPSCLLLSWVKFFPRHLRVSITLGRQESFRT